MGEALKGRFGANPLRAIRITLWALLGFASCRAVPPVAAPTPIEMAAVRLADAGWALDVRELRWETASVEDLRRVVAAQTKQSQGQGRLDALSALLGALLNTSLDSKLSFEELVDVQAARYLALYDPTSRTVFHVDREFEPDGSSHLETWVHELVHARQHQLGVLPDEIPSFSDNDSLQAFRCQIEGEASFVAPFVTDSSLRFEELRGRTFLLSAAALEAGMDALAYEAGAAYFLALCEEFSAPAVDRIAARARASTEQILHPLQLGADEPVSVELPAPDPGADVLHVDTLGELQILHLLHLLGLGRPEAHLAACGWGGDSLRLERFTNAELRILWRTEWDSEADAHEFEAALRSRGSRHVARTGRRVEVDSATISAQPKMATAFLLGDESLEAQPDAVRRAEEQLMAAYREELAEECSYFEPHGSGLRIPIPEGWELREGSHGESLVAVLPGERFVPNSSVRVRASEGHVLDDARASSSRAELEAAGYRVLGVRLESNSEVPALTLEFVHPESDFHGVVQILVHAERWVTLTFVGQTRSMPRLRQRLAALLAGIEAMPPSAPQDPGMLRRSVR